MNSLTSILPLSATQEDEKSRSSRERFRRTQASLPQITPWVLGLFQWYARRYIRRHFHAVRLAGECVIPQDTPLVAYCNHASWWDPMLLMLLGGRVAPRRKHFAPVDSEAIERYAMFKRMGLFGVERNHPRGAVAFLRTSRAILSTPGTALWLTPQGRFADVRQRPAVFQRGLGMLAARCSDTVFLPVAIEYCFWEERLPEVLVWIGEPLRVHVGAGEDSRGWSARLEKRLTETQDQLAQASITRDTSRFRTVLSGTGGVGGVYDAWRSCKARLRGELFQREHGNL